MSPRPVLAVDLGGTKTAAALVRDGRILQRRERPTPPAPDIDDLLESVAGIAIGWLGEVDRIAVATAGLVADGRLDAVNRAIFRLTGPVPFQHPLEVALGRPVTLLNDGQAAAWGEYRFGAGRRCRSMVFMTISTGIGGGIVTDGRLWIGRSGLAGHLGFTLADPRGPVCGSGKRGTLEALASGRAIAARAGRPAAEVFARAADDPDCEALLDETAALTARALADLASLIDPELVVVGGGVGLAPGYLARIARHLETFPELFRPPLAAARLGADAGLVGVADRAMTLDSDP